MIKQFEIEKDTDNNGGVYFDSLEEAVKYYTEEIIFCMEQIKEKTCTDFETFNNIQLNEWIGDEVVILMSYEIPK